MIAAFATWTRECCAGGIVLVGPEGERVRIRPHVDPPPDVRELVNEVATENGSRIREHGTPIEMRTTEGEIARIAWATLDERMCAAAVIAETMCIDAIAPDALAIVELLARELGVGLGERRRRSFSYDAPAAWVRTDAAFATVWRQPETGSIATIFLARPFTATEAERLHRDLFTRMPAGFRSRRVWPVEDVTSTAGLTGRLRIESGHRCGIEAMRVAASFGDDRFLYLAHFEGADLDTEVFRALVVSFHPVPRTSVTTSVWRE